MVLPVSVNRKLRGATDTRPDCTSGVIEGAAGQDEAGGGNVHPLDAFTVETMAARPHSQLSTCACPRGSTAEGEVGARPLSAHACERIPTETQRSARRRTAAMQRLLRRTRSRDPYGNGRLGLESFRAGVIPGSQPRFGPRFTHRRQVSCAGAIIARQAKIPKEN